MKDFYFPKEEGGGYDAKSTIIFALKEYLEAEKNLRACPESWQSCCGTSPNYETAQAVHRYAARDLWEVTDIEYDQDGFREFVWNWRYWKIMARKCCWYQKSELSRWQAGDTMKSLENAEYQFAQVCGLLDIYENPHIAIARQFPYLYVDGNQVLVGESKEELERKCKMATDAGVYTCPVCHLEYFKTVRKCPSCLHPRADITTTIGGSWWTAVKNWLATIVK